MKKWIFRKYFTKCTVMNHRKSKTNPLNWIETIHFKPMWWFPRRWIFEYLELLRQELRQLKHVKTD